MTPKVAVIIVSYNGQKYLPDCLSSLARTEYNKDSWKIVVVDNASTDGSVGWIKQNYSQLILLEQTKNKGFAEGNNIGMRWAIKRDYDYVFLLNQDTVVTANWLQPLVELAESDKQIAAVQPKIKLWPDQNKINTVGNIIHFLGFGYGRGSGKEDQGQYDKIQEINYPSGAGVLFRVDCLKKVGLFDEDMFMYLEDLDLGWRLWLAGYKCLFQPNSIIYHKYEFKRSLKMVYYFERNRYISLLKNYKIGTLILLLPACLIMEIGQLFFSVTNKWFLKKLATYFYFTNPHVWIKIGEHRRKFKKVRQRTDKEMLEMFNGRILFQPINNPFLLYVANPFFYLYLKILQLIVRW